LLDRNPLTRLGSQNDVFDIISHPFFEGIEFDKLCKKEIEAPYKPAPEQLTLKDEEMDFEASDALQDVSVLN